MTQYVNFIGSFVYIVKKLKSRIVEVSTYKLIINLIFSNKIINT